MALFIDLSVRPRDPETLEHIASTARRLGIRVVGAPAHLIEGRSRCINGVLIVPRYVVSASTRREAHRGLRDAPSGVLVVLEAQAADAARYAAVQKRVDVLRLPPRLASLVDRSTARLFRERGWGLIEFPLPQETGAPALSTLAVALRRAEAYSIPLALVSDASDPLSLWHPLTAVGLAASLGVPWERSLSLITTNPLSVLLRRGWGRDAVRECTSSTANEK